ncbi:hypothetical protein ACFQ07_13075, partial [Actinomadura adrarensis]
MVQPAEPSAADRWVGRVGILLGASAAFAVYDLTGYEANPTFPWIIGCALVAVLAALPLYTVMSRRSTHKGGRVGLVIGAALACYTSFLSGTDDVHLAWEAEPDRPTAVRAAGAWLDGDTVIRVRQDRAIAYRVGDGMQRWTWAP